MHPTARILLPLLLLGGLGLAVGYGLQHDGGGAPPGPARPDPAPYPAVDQRESPAPGPAVAALPPAATEALPVPQPGERELATARAPQGIEGRVLEPGGAPAQGVPVYLLAASSADAVQLWLASKSGRKVQPVAEARTDADGRFAIGIVRADQTYDLRVAPDVFPELHLRSIKPHAGDWYDCRDLQLLAGLVVQGRVVEETTLVPIAGAQVFLQSPDQLHRLQATPGRERGIPAETDRSGSFRFTNAPREGLITLEAEAPGHAPAERPNLAIQADAVNEFTLELPRGEPIAGIVVDAAGAPVGGAAVNVTAMSAKTPFQTSTRSAQDGTFTVPMLRPGPYKLQATASGFEDAAGEVVFTGRDDVKLVLDQGARVRLRVLSARGTPVRAFTAALRRHFPNQPGTIGKVLEFHDVRITPADHEGPWAIVRNVPAGEFVFQITDAEHAKTLSPPFQTGRGLPAPDVEVTLTAGASITGTVVDDRGQPVAGADVASDMNGALIGDTPFKEVFGPFMPDKHTTRTAKTDAAGRFTLAKLSFADYMVRVSHADFCAGTATDVALTSAGQTVDVGTIALARGALLEGLCTLAGQPLGQVKVFLGPPEGAKPQLAGDGKARPFFGFSAVTGSDGRYSMLQRVPPGTYQIHAARQASSGNIFEQFGDMQATRRQLVIGGGQDRLVQTFELPAR